MNSVPHLEERNEYRIKVGQKHKYNLMYKYLNVLVELLRLSNEFTQSAKWGYVILESHLQQFS
jgi:hypothetical protein